MPEMACGFKSRSSHHHRREPKNCSIIPSNIRSSSCHFCRRARGDDDFSIKDAVSYRLDKHFYQSFQHLIVSIQVAHSLLNRVFREHHEMKNADVAIKLLTLAEAASILKISKRTLHRMIQHRQIPAFKVGGQWRILESRFHEWVQEEETTTPKAS